MAALPGQDQAAPGPEDEEVPFPYQPYPAQRALMLQILDTLKASSFHPSDRHLARPGLASATAPALAAGAPAEADDWWPQVGLFESPTGTGKTLSLICSVLHWRFNVYPEQHRRAREQQRLRNQSPPSPPPPPPGQVHRPPQPPPPGQEQRGQRAQLTQQDQPTQEDSALEAPDWVRAHMLRQEEERRRLAEQSLQETLDRLPAVDTLLQLDPAKLPAAAATAGDRRHPHRLAGPARRPGDAAAHTQADGDDDDEEEEELVRRVQSRQLRGKRSHRRILLDDDDVEDEDAEVAGDNDDNDKDGSERKSDRPSRRRPTAEGLGWIRVAKQKLDALEQQLAVDGEAKAQQQQEEDGIDWSEFAIHWTPSSSAEPGTGASSSLAVSAASVLRETKLLDFQNEAEELDEQEPKIIFCSRTHSQIKQFLQELEKSGWSKRIRCVSLGSRAHLCVNPAVMRLKNASMINDKCLDLQRSKTATRPGCSFLSRARPPKKQAEEASARSSEAQERDTKRIRLVLGSASSSASSAGSKRQPKLSQALADRLPDLTLLRNYALKLPMDLEDLHRLGSHLQTCPYYASRKAVRAAHLLTLPYASLMHAGARQSLGISVRGAVVIVDEAHNLIETLNDLHSPHISLQVLEQAEGQLQLYLERYGPRLESAQLALMFRQLMTLLTSCLGFLRRSAQEHEGAGAAAQQVPPPKASHAAPPNPGAAAVEPRRLVLGVTDFLFQAGLDNVNLFAVHRFLEESELSKKIIGFYDKYLQVKRARADAEAQAQEPSSSEAPAAETSDTEAGYEFKQASPLQPFTAFLEALLNADKDGRIVLELCGSDSSIRFLMLQPSVHFQGVLREARAVLLLGGTMQPFSHFSNLLFHAVPRQNIREFACGHVVDPENVLAVSLSAGPTKRALNFSFRQRSNPELLSELGRVLLNICNLTPNGVVVFFPSYAYEEQAFNHLEATGVLRKLEEKKRVFRECRGSANVAEILDQYSAQCKPAPGHSFPGAQTGALLTSVIGGKLSEGINFADHLARCVVVVGLPYPNREDPVLQQKMRFLNEQQQSRRAASASSAPAPAAPGGQATAGEAYYQNLCMRAVNQSIGRTIRHKNDFGCILLLDERYRSRPEVYLQLPEWIRNRLQASQHFGQAVAAISRFFSGKRQQGLL